MPRRPPARTEYREVKPYLAYLTHLQQLKSTHGATVRGIAAEMSARGHPIVYSTVSDLLSGHRFPVHGGAQTTRVLVLAIVEQ